MRLLGALRHSLRVIGVLLEALVRIALSLATVEDCIRVRMLRATVQDLSVRDLLIALASASEVLVGILEMLATARRLVEA